MLSSIVLRYEKVIDQPDLAYATFGSAAFDLRGFFTPALKELAADQGDCSKFLLRSGESVVLRSGVKFKIPPSFFLNVYIRSGMGFKKDITLINSVGVIDSDYTDEVLIKLIALGEDVELIDGDRVAQATLERLEKANLIVVDSIEQTGRSGFGSTGDK